MLSLFLLLAQLAPVTAVTVAPNETMTVQVRGAGASIVLVPGLFGSVHGFRRLTDDLVAAGYRVIAIEPLGVGTSARPRNADYSQTAQAARVAAVLDSLDVPSALVVAHSAGATLAFRLALLRPDLVRGLVSLEGGPDERLGSDGTRRALSLAPILRIIGRGAMRGRVAGELREASGDPGWVTDSVVHVYTDGPAEDYGATLRAMQAIVNASEPWPLLPALGNLAVPVVLVLGTAPHRGGPDDAVVRMMEAGIPHLQVRRLEDVGHYAFEENPSALALLLRQIDGEVRATAVADLSAQPSP